MHEMPTMPLGQSSQQATLFNIFTRLSTLMMHVDDEASFMQTALSDMGQSFDVSRVYTYSLHGSVWTHTYEWTASHVSCGQERLPFIDMASMHEDSILPQLAKGKTFSIDDAAQIEDSFVRRALAEQNVMSLVAFPFFYKGNVVGLLGFDQCKDVPQWASKHLEVVIALGSLMNTAYAYYAGKRFLQQKRTQLQALFDSMPMPIYVSDCEDYSVYFCNKVIHDNFDTSDIENKKCHEVFQNLDTPCPFCTNASLKPGAPPYVWHHRNELVGLDYKVVDSLATWEGKENARFSIALDITESLRLQREHVLDCEANVARGRFVANMSHELRTPLNGIIGLTHLASKANKDPVVDDYLRKIQFSSNNLLSVINETLDLSDMAAQNIILENNPFSIEDVLRGAEALLQTEVDRKGIGLHVICEKGIPYMLMGDAQRLAQVVLNLTSNAVKFTSEGSVTLKVQLCAPLDGKEEHAHKVWLRLDVADTGIGISKEQSQKLFQEYSQVDSSTSRNFGGTGLGLVISKKFVELMGGEISVHGEPHKGTTFSCIFPLALCHAHTDSTQSEDEVEENSVKFDISGAKVLLVEDNTINALIACEVLMSYGCVVKNVENGREAIQALENEAFDIVLMDIQMPIMDGLQATKFIRSIRRFDHIPIVAMTAHAMVQDYEKSLEAGMQAHVTKPFSPEELCETVHKFISQDFCFSPVQL